MSSDRRGIALVVFARVPEPGRVKTRLIDSLGPDGACNLHRHLLARTLEVADRAAFATHELCLDPGPEPGLLPRGTSSRWYVTGQSSGDLGTRMQSVAARLLAEHVGVIIIGSDCPVMKASYLHAAAAVLERGNDVVIGPADDGGYVLLGLSRTVPELFRDIPWGGDQVLAVTRQRLARYGEGENVEPLRYAELETLWDVDTARDLRRYESLRSAVS